MIHDFDHCDGVLLVMGICQKRDDCRRYAGHVELEAMQAPRLPNRISYLFAEECVKEGHYNFLKNKTGEENV
jgi:hypothetical protein